MQIDRRLVGEDRDGKPGAEREAAELDIGALRGLRWRLFVAGSQFGEILAIDCPVNQDRFAYADCGLCELTGCRFAIVSRRCQAALDDRLAALAPRGRGG